MERKKIHKFKSKVIETINLTPSVKHLTIDIPDNFYFYPGQFISVFLNKENRTIRRPYSIASKPNLSYLDLCIKIVENGLASSIINNLKIGDGIDVLGPMGDFTIKDPSKDLVFISTGTGIGPFRSMIPYLIENNFKNKIILLTGYRYEEDALYEDEFLTLKNKYKNFSYEKILSKTTPNEDKQKEKNENGYVQNLVKNHTNSEYHYYICGLKEMVNSVKDLLLEKGIPKENIFFEKYD